MRELPPAVRRWDRGELSVTVRQKTVLLSIDHMAHVLLSPFLFYRRARAGTISSQLGRVKLAAARDMCWREFHGAPRPCGECIARALVPWRYPLARLIDIGLELTDPGHSIRSIEDDR